jgi:hypothetical protein
VAAEAREGGAGLGRAHDWLVVTEEGELDSEDRDELEELSLPLAVEEPLDPDVSVDVAPSLELDSAPEVVDSVELEPVVLELEPLDPDFVPVVLALEPLDPDFVPVVLVPVPLALNVLVELVECFARESAGS